MARTEGQKGKILLLLRILERYTDEDHWISVPRILELLEEQGIHAERKSIYSDIEALQEMGYDILQQRGRSGGYCLATRTFQLPELKLLADAVQASRFITRKKSEQLIRTLSRFASEWQAADLKRQVFASRRVKTMNESIYYNVDTLHRAIAQDRQVRFVYQEWDLAKRKVARRGGEGYVVSPWALLWENENYYLVAYTEGQGLRHYRVARPMFNMYGGPVERVQFDCDAAMIGPMLDRFGAEATVVPQPGEKTFHLYADVAVSPTFFGWVCGFGGKVRILGPAGVKEQFGAFLAAIAAAQEAL